MNDLLTILKKDLSHLLDDLKEKKIVNNIDYNNINIDHSSKSKQGDLSTNIYLILVKQLIDKKFNLNHYIENYLNKFDYIQSISIAKAGFVNIFINKKFLLEQINFLLNKFDSNKNFNLSDKKKINIEFVSANPTGPIHVAHMRGAVLGDVLASMLTAVGHDVTREYYVNDAGSQISILGSSLFKRYQQLFNVNVEL